MTTRRASDQRQPCVEVQILAAKRHAEQAEPASVRLDDGHAYRSAGRNAKLTGRLLRQPANPLPHRTDVGADSPEPFAREVAQADRLEVAGIPLPLAAEIRPLAHRAAER